MDDFSNASAAASAYGAGTTYTVKGAGDGKKTDRNKYAAEVANDWAMALFNKDLEQSQWERNNAYNDPLAQYQRLINAGMNPLTAMQSIAGVGTTTSDQAGDVHGVASAKAGSGSEQAAAQRMATAVSAAQGISQSMKNLADAGLARTQAKLMPDQVHTLQDLQQSQSFLMRQQADVVKALADADVSAKQSAAKLNEVQSWVQRQMEHLYRQQWMYQQKELQWFDFDKVRDYHKAFAETNELFTRVKSNLAQAGLFRAQANVQPALARFYNSSAGKADAEAVGQIINNMYNRFGLPRNVLGAVLINQLDWNGLIDQFGNWKKGARFDVNQPWYQTYNYMKNLDFDIMNNNFTLGQKVIDETVSKTWVNNSQAVLNGARTIESGTNSLKNIFNLANPMSHGTPIMVAP